MNTPARIANHVPDAGPVNLPSIRSSEAASAEDMLRILGATRGPALVPYGTHAAHCRDHHLMYYGQLCNAHQYIPYNISLETLRAAARAIKPLQSPAYQQRNMAALGRLYTLTASQKRTPDQENHLLNTYLNQLRDYPPNAVEYVLAQMAETMKFFPTWADIAAPLNEIAGWRYVHFTKISSIAMQIQQRNADHDT